MARRSAARLPPSWQCVPALIIGTILDPESRTVAAALP